MITIRQDTFGLTRSGETVTRTVLTNTEGTEIALLNYGAIIHEIRTKDRSGRLSNIVLNCDLVDKYENQFAYLGAVAGRTANRTDCGHLVLDHQEYQLECNNGHNHLHGGNKGFSHVLWQHSTEHHNDSASVTMTYLSVDGEGHYPGNLTASVTYTLTENNQLDIFYRATTDKTTVVNLTQHSYFNLAGKGDCLSHILQLNADHYLPTDETAIPIGSVTSVSETPFDFRTPKSIGRDISLNDPQLIIGKGYDHNFCLAKNSKALNSNTLNEFATVTEPDSGRTITVATDQPGVQFYSGNYLEGIPATGDEHYLSRQGFCLETQAWPDAPNQPEFPSTVLKPGETYQHHTVFTFSCES